MLPLLETRQTVDSMPTAQPPVEACVREDMCERRCVRGVLGCVLEILVV